MRGWELLSWIFLLITSVPSFASQYGQKHRRKAGRQAGRHVGVSEARKNTPHCCVSSNCSNISCCLLQSLLIKLDQVLKVRDKLENYTICNCIIIQYLFQCNIKGKRIQTRYIIILWYLSTVTGPSIFLEGCTSLSGSWTDTGEGVPLFCLSHTISASTVARKRLCPALKLKPFLFQILAYSCFHVDHISKFTLLHFSTINTQ